MKIRLLIPPLLCLAFAAQPVNLLPGLALGALLWIAARRPFSRRLLQISRYCHTEPHASPISGARREHRVDGEMEPTYASECA